MPANYDEKFMNRAAELAKQAVAAGEGGPFGAVIVREGEIIAEGGNRVLASHDATAHAEMIVIRQACEKLGNFNLEGCELYATGEPCPMCFGAIYWTHLDNVYFANGKSDAAAIGFDDAFIYEEMNRAPESRRIAFYERANLAAAEAFDAWRLKDDKTPY